MRSRGDCQWLDHRRMTRVAAARLAVPRETGALAYRPELDGIRAIAVLLVVAAHLEVPGFVLGGYTGVTLFFVLSGYLITSLLIAERARTGGLDIAAFYGRRVRRLLPALVLVLLIVAGWSIAIGRQPWEIGPVIFYVANWFRVAGSDLGLMPHAWSLSVEEQFYIVWPAILLVVGRRAPLVCIAGIGAAIVLRLVASDGELQYGTFARGDAILYGALFALVGVRFRWGWLAAVPILAFVTAVPLPVLMGPWPVLVALAACLLITSAPRILATRPLVWIGRRSYGIYLWHMLPVLAVRPLLPDVGLSVVVVVFSLVGAWASFRWVEQPVRIRSLRLRVPRPIQDPAAPVPTL